MNDIQKFIIEQAVYLTAHEENTPWNLSDNVSRVAEALKKANEEIKDKELLK